MDSKKILNRLIPQVSIHIWIILLLTVVIACWTGRWQYRACIVCLPRMAHIRTNYRRKAAISDFIENLNLNIDTATRDTLLNFPMPLVITEPDGSIIWYNSSFRDISEQTDVSEDTVRTVVDEIRSELHADSPGRKHMPVTRQINLDGRHYNVLCTVVRREQQDITSFMLILYFVDTTEYVRLKQTYADEKVAAGIFVIDNYDDLMQRWRTRQAADTGRDRQKSGPVGFLHRRYNKKYERDKYLFIFEQKYMKDRRKEV